LSFAPRQRRELCFCFPSHRSSPTRTGFVLRSAKWNAAAPGWIILDEYNRIELDKPSDFESTMPLGSFSPAFIKQIALTVKNAAAAQRLTGITRS